MDLARLGFFNPLTIETLRQQAALLPQLPRPSAQSDGGGKMHSFRISDILHAHASVKPTAAAAVAVDCASDVDSNSSSGQPSPLLGESAARDGETRDDDGEVQLSPASTGGGGCKKSRKARTIFTDKQLATLEQSFEKQKYLSVTDRMELAHRMGLSDTQVKTWYQNRRTKHKRQTAVGYELLAEAGNMNAVQQALRANPYWTAYLSMPSAPPPAFLSPMASLNPFWPRADLLGQTATSIAATSTASLDQLKCSG